MRQLTKLSQPFPPAFIEKSPQGQDYVAHHIINQALLATVGPFSFELVEILRGYVPEQTFKRGQAGEYTKPPLESAIVGAVYRLTVEIDGRTVSVEEVGDVEHPQNWGQDGARLKDAASDAIKRCALRLGLGIHLWAQEHFFLHSSLLAKDEEDGTKAEQSTQTTDIGEASSAAPQISLRGNVGAEQGNAATPSPSAPSRHKDVKERQLGHIHALADKLGMNHDRLRELAKVEGVMPASDSMADMTNVQRAKLLAVLTEMQEQEKASA